MLNYKLIINYKYVNQGQNGRPNQSCRTRGEFYVKRKGVEKELHCKRKLIETSGKVFAAFLQIHYTNFRTECYLNFQTQSSELLEKRV